MRSEQERNIFAMDLIFGPEMWFNHGHLDIEDITSQRILCYWCVQSFSYNQDDKRFCLIYFTMLTSHTGALYETLSHQYDPDSIVRYHPMV